MTKEKAPNPHADLLNLAQGLRTYYRRGNPIHAMLGELIKDLKAQAPREEIISDATALHARLDPHSSAYMVIGRILSAM